MFRLSLGGTSLTDFAVVHGPWQLTPHAQPAPGVPGAPPTSVALKPSELTEQPVRFRNTAQVGQTITSVAEARQLPYWRDPSVPADWTFSHVYVGGGLSPPGYEAVYIAPSGEYPAVSIWARHTEWRRLPAAASWLTNHIPPRRFVHELRVVADRPAVVQYSPLGAQHDRGATVRVFIYDAATECIYEVEGRSGSLGLRGGPAALERLLVIATSLFESPNAP